MPYRGPLAASRFAVEHWPAPLRVPYEYAMFYLLLLVFGALTLSWSLIAAGLCRVLPTSRHAAIGQPAIMTGFRFWVAAMRASGLLRCDLRALDALGRDRPLVIAANHPSLMDALLVISRLPRVVCVTKASLWDSWLLGGSVRLARYIRNDAPLALVKDAVGRLRAGEQLLVFPEGTRTTQHPVGRLHGGFALMARGGRTSVQTVFLETNSTFVAKGTSPFKKPAFPLLYRARLGPRRTVSRAGSVDGFVADQAAIFASNLGDPTRPPP